MTEAGGRCAGIAGRQAGTAEVPVPCGVGREGCGFFLKCNKITKTSGRSAGAASGAGGAREQRRKIFRLYAAALGDLLGMVVMPEPAWNGNNRWLTVSTLDPAVCGANGVAVWIAPERGKTSNPNRSKRPSVASQFWEEGGSAQGPPRGWRASPIRVAGANEAQKLFGKGLSLRSETALNEADMERVVDIFRGVIRRFREA